MIEENILNTMLQTGLLAITIPVVLIVAWKMYSKKSLVPFWTGIMIFIAFSRVLEMVPHMVFLVLDSPVSRLINSNAVLYAIYGGLMAGLFEETGRYVAFRFLLKNHTAKETAVTYGIGHGGIECILILGVTYIQYYAYGQLINSGSMEKMIAAYQADASSKEALEQLIDTIRSITRPMCYLADWERVSAMMVQIALSILVFQAVYVAGKTYMLWVSVALHMMMDFPAALYQKGVLGLVPTEISIFVFAVLVLLYAVRVYGSLDGRGGGTGGSAVSAEEEEKRHQLHQIANRRFDPSPKDSGQ